MKCLITGGAGFIGSHLLNRLIKEGHKVCVLDNLIASKKTNLNFKVPFYNVDIQDTKVSDIFKKEKPEAVFHYAAQIDTQKSIENPVNNAKINILGALNILENCKKFKIKKIIFPSTVGVYGEPKSLPIKENHSLSPIAPYAITKLTIEKYLNYYQSQGLDFVVLRYSNIYGPGQPSDGGGRGIANIINRILKGEKPVVFGEGKQTRDFLYIEDAVSATIKAMRSPPGVIFNIGVNKETTIINLVKIISSLLNKEVKPLFRPLPRGVIIKSRVDFSKAKRELGWQPKYNLEKGLAKTIKWHLEKPKNII